MAVKIKFKIKNFGDFQIQVYPIFMSGIFVHCHTGIFIEKIFFWDESYFVDSGRFQTLLSKKLSFRIMKNFFHHAITIIGRVFWKKSRFITGDVTDFVNFANFTFFGIKSEIYHF